MLPPRGLRLKCKSLVVIALPPNKTPIAKFNRPSAVFLIKLATPYVLPDFNQFYRWLWHNLIESYSGLALFESAPAIAKSR